MYRTALKQDYDSLEFSSQTWFKFKILLESRPIFSQFRDVKINLFCYNFIWFVGLSSTLNWVNRIILFSLVYEKNIYVQHYWPIWSEIIAQPDFLFAWAWQDTNCIYFGEEKKWNLFVWLFQWLFNISVIFLASVMRKTSFTIISTEITV